MLDIGKGVGERNVVRQERGLEYPRSQGAKGTLQVA